MAQNVRLLPVLMVTAGVVLALKAAGVAEAASEAEPKDDHAPKAAAATPAPKPAAKEAACPPLSFADQAGLSAQEVEVLQSLGARRAQLDQRAAEIDMQAELLAAAEKRVGERLAELKRVQGNVDAQLAKIEVGQSERITGLINVYQKMKVKDAAEIFNQLDEDILVDVAGGMKQAVLAEVMGAMQPERARKLTRLLADQRKLPDGAVTAAAAATPAKPAAAKPAPAKPTT